MKTLEESNQLLVSEGWTVEIFDGQQIARKTEGEKSYICIRSPQARARGRMAGLFYSFTSDANREAWYSHWKEQREAKIAVRASKQAVKTAAREAFVNPHKVGDILHSSWGYEQTNVEFFEVLEVRPRALKLVEIAGNLVETGFMSGHTTPQAGKAIGDPKWVTLQISVYDGKTHHHVPSPLHGCLYPTAKGESVSCSWYA